MKTKKPKTAKQSKPSSKKPEYKLVKPIRLKPGDRVYCEYRCERFPIKGTVVTCLLDEYIDRVLIRHDEDVMQTFGWGVSSMHRTDTSHYKVWGAQYVFPVRE